MRTVWRMAVLAALLLAVGNCKLDDFVVGENGEPEGPIAGTLLLVLNTPNADDGAVRLTLSGPRLTTPRTTTAEYLVYSRQRSPQELDIVVVGDLQAEAVVAMPIWDIATVDQYSAVVTEAATRSDSLRTDLTAYSVVIQALPDAPSGN